jgi:hypothetical protein
MQDTIDDFQEESVQLRMELWEAHSRLSSVSKRLIYLQVEKSKIQVSYKYIEQSIALIKVYSPCYSYIIYDGVYRLAWWPVITKHIH